jgi:hypothetical protein
MASLCDKVERLELQKMPNIVHCYRLRLSTAKVENEFSAPQQTVQKMPSLINSAAISARIISDLNWSTYSESTMILFIDARMLGQKRSAGHTSRFPKFSFMVVTKTWICWRSGSSLLNERPNKKPSVTPTTHRYSSSFGLKG